MAERKFWLNRKAVAAVVAISSVAAILCAAVLWNGAYLARMALQEETQQASKEAQLTRDAFEIHSLDLVNYVDAYLRSLRAAYLREVSLDDVRYFLERVPFDQAIVDDVAITDANGKLVFWSGGKDLKEVTLADRDYFRQQQSAQSDEIVFSPVELGKISSRHLFRMSRRMVHPDGSFAGVILISVDPYSIARFYRDLRVGPQSTTSLVGTEDRKLRARFPLVDAQQWNVQGWIPLWDALKKSAEGSYEAVSHIDGIRRTFVYRKLDHFPLAVVVGFSAADVLQRIESRQRRQKISEMIIIAAVLGISLLLIVVAVNRQMLSAAHRDLRDLYEKVRELALFDALTGLPNRNLLEDRLLQALRDAERSQESCALMYVDLDDFKQINDTIGHAAGDHVLEVTASRMLAAVRATDTVSRRGGDEFVVLVPHAGTLDEILEVADRLVQWVSEPIAYKGMQCRVSVSVGVAIYPGNGNQAGEMIRAADEAMYEAKRKGKNTIVLAKGATAFEPEVAI